MFDVIGNFFQQYFADPIIYGTGYNIYNTIAYAVVFAFAAIAVYKLLRHYRVEINAHFLTGLIPYIILGSILRVMQDAGITQTYFFVTPLIYFFILAVALGFLAISRIMQKVQNKPASEYWKTWLIFGLACCLIALIPFSFVNLQAGMLIAGIFSGWAVLFLGIKKFVRTNSIQHLLSWVNIAVLFAHIFDATTTFVSLQFFAYSEQHVLAGAVIDMFGPVGMYILKIPVILAVLFVLDKQLPDRITGIAYSARKQERIFIKLAILILGLGPGLRNALRLIAGV